MERARILRKLDTLDSSERAYVLATIKRTRQWKIRIQRAAMVVNGTAKAVCRKLGPFHRWLTAAMVLEHFKEKTKQPENPGITVAIDRIDLALLKRQKREITSLQSILENLMPGTSSRAAAWEALEGVINLMDHIQDVGERRLIQPVGETFRGILALSRAHWNVQAIAPQDRKALLEIGDLCTIHLEKEKT
jgi:hypothetical protein